jgi:hypothetical protein
MKSDAGFELFVILIIKNRFIIKTKSIILNPFFFDNGLTNINSVS